MTSHDLLRFIVFACVFFIVPATVWFLRHFQKLSDVYFLDVRIADHTRLRDMRRQHRKRYYTELRKWQNAIASDADDRGFHHPMLKLFHDAVDSANADIDEQNKVIKKLEAEKRKHKRK